MGKSCRAKPSVVVVVVVVVVVGFKTIEVFDVDGAEHKRYMRLRRKKYCGAGISDTLSHLS